ncbi:hypothetical protein DKX38_018854 [Salix brachista]|uniref:Uncharacterized protein n=1 Tax=Salix brachista TaxID=2182728 RepID=A0A5N5KP56_9ROSI|nr:hypothetical protein DKX38_018854 [Salix brachista]
MITQDSDLILPSGESYERNTLIPEMIKEIALPDSETSKRICLHPDMILQALQSAIWIVNFIDIVFEMKPITVNYVIFILRKIVNTRGGKTVR